MYQQLASKEANACDDFARQFIRESSLVNTLGNASDISLCKVRSYWADSKPLRLLAAKFFINLHLYR
nr:MAG TPA: hypothetical protein [Caudoviricetes sp.]